ncbi:allergen Tha p 1-like [Rhodnius prolixus]
MYTKVLVILALTVYFCYAAKKVTTYTDKYDKIDVDAILNNERVLKRYIDCLMDRARCTPDGTELKKYIPEALETECAKCTDAQKRFAGKVMSFLLLNKRNYWNQLLGKYDPNGKFRKKYEEATLEDEDYSSFYNE